MLRTFILPSVASALPILCPALWSHPSSSFDRCCLWGNCGVDSPSCAGSVGWCPSKQTVSRHPTDQDQFCCTGLWDDACSDYSSHCADSQLEHATSRRLPAEDNGKGKGKGVDADADDDVDFTEEAEEEEEEEENKSGKGKGKGVDADADDEEDEEDENDIGKGKGKGVDAEEDAVEEEVNSGKGKGKGNTLSTQGMQSTRVGGVLKGARNAKQQARAAWERPVTEPSIPPDTLD